MAASSVRVIQVGAGGFGRLWRKGLSECAGEVVALVDRDPEALEEAGSHYGLAEDRWFAPDQEWDTVEADLVIDSSPHAHHRRNAERAFAAGLDVLVVKPMAQEEADCQAMVGLAHERGRKLAVAQQLRFHPLIMKLRELVQGGAVGQPGLVHLDWFRALPDPAAPPLLSRPGWSQPFPMLVECAVHIFDYLRWVTGYEPVSVWGRSFNLPWSIPTGHDLDAAPQTCAHAHFEMARPGASPLHVVFRSVATRARQDSWLSHWHIEGDAGLLRVEADRICLNGEEVPVAWSDGRPISDLGIGDHLNGLVLREFLDWRTGGPEPGFSGRNNLPTIGMVFGVIRSSQTGAEVRLSERSE